MGIWSWLMSLLTLLGIGGEPAETPEWDDAPLSGYEMILSEGWESATFGKAGELPEISPEYDPKDKGLPEKELLSSGVVDASLFYERCEELMELAEGRDAEAVLEQYDLLYADFLLVDTQSSLDYLAYCGDVLDETLVNKSAESENLCSTLGAALCDAARAVMEGPCAEEFRPHIGDVAADYFVTFESYTGRASDLLTRETELETEYYDILARSYEWSYSYDGRDWTMDDLMGSAGDRLYEEDVDGYFEVYDALLADVNAELGAVFLELVQVRDEFAELQGYDSYADYAYEQLLYRDFTTDDAQAFCDAVKAGVSQDYYDEVYYSYADDAAYEENGVWDAAMLMETLGRYAETVHPQAGQAFEMLQNDGLYDIAAGNRRMDSAFNINVPGENNSRIFMTISSADSDFAVLSHEFGHFFDNCLTPVPNALTDTGSFDLFEVHSNGMEILYLPYYDEIYGERAVAAEYAVLAEQLASIVDGCLFDEFQRRVYAEPDMSLQELNELYAELCMEYGEYDWEDEDLYWVYISHSFDSPLYYISYATSALAALQLWEQSRENYDAAVVHYMDIVRAGAYEKGYLQVMKEAGLRSFRSEGVVEDVCQPVLDYLWSLW